MPEQGFTVKEIVIEISKDVKELKVSVDERFAQQDERLRAVEASGFRLSGAWSTLGIVFSLLAGGTGLVLGVLSAL